MSELYICIVPRFRHIHFVHPLVRVDDFECQTFARRLPADTKLKIIGARDRWYVLFGVELSEGRENSLLDVFKFLLALGRKKYCCLVSFDHEMDRLWFGLEGHFESTPWMRGMRWERSR